MEKGKTAEKLKPRNVENRRETLAIKD